MEVLSVAGQNEVDQQEPAEMQDVVGKHSKDWGQDETDEKDGTTLGCDEDMDRDSDSDSDSDSDRLSCEAERGRAAEAAVVEAGEAEGVVTWMLISPVAVVLANRGVVLVAHDQVGRGQQSAWTVQVVTGTDEADSQNEVDSPAVSQAVYV